jgi:hypothetical protein
MASATDTRLIAAHLTAALIIKGHPFLGTKLQDIARLYFDCLDALRAEEEKRPKKAPQAATGTYQTRR